MNTVSEKAAGVTQLLISSHPLHGVQNGTAFAIASVKAVLYML
jgi:hypothetical protein